MAVAIAVGNRHRRGHKTCKVQHIIMGRPLRSIHQMLQRNILRQRDNTSCRVDHQRERSLRAAIGVLAGYRRRVGLDQRDREVSQCRHQRCRATSSQRQCISRSPCTRSTICTICKRRCNHGTRAARADREAAGIGGTFVHRHACRSNRIAHQRHVIIDSDGEGSCSCDAVTIAIGRLQQAAELQHYVILVRAIGMIERTQKRKVPLPRRRIQRQREHRVHARTRRQHIARKRIAHRNTSRRQRRKTRNRTRQLIGQRRVRTRRKQPRNRARRRRRSTRNIARLHSRDTARQTILVHRPRLRTRNRNRRVVINVDHQRARRRVIVAIGHRVPKRERHIILVRTRRMHHRRILRHRISTRRRVQRHRRNRHPVARTLLLLDQDITARSRIAITRRRARRQEPNAPAIIAKAVRQHANRVRRVRIDITRTTRIATKAVIIQLNSHIHTSTRRIVDKAQHAADIGGSRRSVSIAIGHGLRQGNEVANQCSHIVRPGIGRMDDGA